MAERILVLNVDIDNDLYRKTKLSGPIIGRIDNLRAASKLALSDPQDSDSNAMFEAVRKYDELKKAGRSVAIATITGAEDEGYAADAELVRQVDMVIERLKCESCVLVTDGSSDARIVPLLKNRIKINSIDIVRIKQAEALESAYFTVLEKLKEPHYARIVFGIPALILLLFGISYYFNLGWELPVLLIGIYLVIKAFGLEESLIRSFKGFGFSIDRISFIFYTASIIFFIIALLVASANYIKFAPAENGYLVAYSAAAEGFIAIFPLCLILYLVGRIIDLETRRLRYRAISQGIYIGYSIIALALLYLTTSWFVGQIYFWQFLLYSFVAIAVGYMLSLFTVMLKRRVIRRTKMNGKRVMTDIGSYVGKVADVDPRRGIIFVKTNYGNVIKYEIDRITTVSDSIVIK
jgi:putative membrane protein